MASRKKGSHVVGLPYFRFYPKDWICDTRDLSDRAKGAYIDILAAMYARGGPLPYDEKFLCSLMNYKQVRSMRHTFDELIQTEKLRIVGGHVVNGRAMEEIADGNRRIDNATSGGFARANATKTSPKPAQNRLKTSRKTAETAPPIEQNQQFNFCYSASASASDKEEEDSLRESKKKKASRLSESWTLPDEWRAWAVKHLNGQSLDVGAEGDKFRDYWISKAGASATKINWEATWRNWVRNAIGYQGRSPPSRTGYKNGKSPLIQAIDRMIDEEDWKL